MIAVKDIDEREMFRFYGRALLVPFKGFAARDGFRTVAIGGLYLGTDGKVWGFIDFKPGYRLRAIYRYMLKILDWAENEGIPEIRVSRDVTLFTSGPLLTRAGFERDGEIEGHEIWIWRNRNVRH
jgi:hypothetical protein